MIGKALPKKLFNLNIKFINQQKSKKSKKKRIKNI